MRYTCICPQERNNIQTDVTVFCIIQQSSYSYTYSINSRSGRKYPFDPSECRVTGSQGVKPWSPKAIACFCLPWVSLRLDPRRARLRHQRPPAARLHPCRSKRCVLLDTARPRRSDSLTSWRQRKCLRRWGLHSTSNKTGTNIKPLLGGNTCLLPLARRFARRSSALTDFH